MPESGAVTLPANVRPSRYDLTLAPDLNDFTFRGAETVEIEVLAPTAEIVLNAAELAVESCRVALPDGSTVSPAETSFSEEEETATFRFDAKLPAGPATLHLEFAGELNDKLRGFYRSRYTDDSGRERFMATTQFEATDARRAFLCWDEPAMKARFRLTLLAPAGLAAVSNMPIVSQKEETPGTSRIEFAETPPMSTYLLAFVVGDLRSIEERAPGGTLIRVWAPAGKEEQGRFALEVAVKLLGYFNDYFGVPYPLEKLDHLAIPDFAAGAMENWGAITYRENALLVDPEQSSAITRQRVATIVAHEMAHMWFGDLVTMAWWNDLWLNESFASWMGDRAVDHLYPEWDMWTQFVSSDTNHALSLDGLRSSHPIEQEVENPAQIGELFDAISYSKGGSVLRMLEQFLGPDAFRDGLRRYITKHQYGNARTADLWDALSEASGQPVGPMMDSWVSQTGYPVIDVRSTRSQSGIDLTVSQKRFVYEHLVEPNVADDTLWWAPVGVRAAGAGETSVLMKGRESRIHVAVGPGESPDAWVKVNPGQTGFYRVSYSQEDADRLRPAIRDRLLPPVDRLGIQNDAYALSRAGYLDATQFLALAEAYASETDATVWADLAANLGGVDDLLGDEPYHGRFQELARRIFQPAGRRVGWVARPGEGHLDALLRTTLLAALGRYDDQDVLSEASALFARYSEDRSAVHPDIRSVALALAAKRGDQSTYDEMWELQKQATMEEEKLRLLTALTQFEAPDLLDETLRRSLLPDEVRVHNTIGIVSGVAVNRQGRDRAWEFVKENWGEFDRRYGEGGFALMRLVSITSRFASQERLEDVRRFFDAHSAPSAERTIRQSLERIGLNIAWLDRNRQALAERFGD